MLDACGKVSSDIGLARVLSCESAFILHKQLASGRRIKREHEHLVEVRPTQPV